MKRFIFIIKDDFKEVKQMEKVKKITSFIFLNYWLVFIVLAILGIGMLTK